MRRESEALEKKLEILKKVASCYSSESEEHEAIKMAAEALLFINMRGYFAEFENGIKEAAQPLTEEQIAYLKSIGCSPY